MMEQPGHPSPKDPEAGRRSGSDARPEERQAQAVRPGDAQPSPSTAEAIERATAALGDDDGTHR